MFDIDNLDNDISNEPKEKQKVQKVSKIQKQLEEYINRMPVNDIKTCYMELNNDDKLFLQTLYDSRYDLEPEVDALINEYDLDTLMKYLLYIYPVMGNMIMTRIVYGNITDEVIRFIHKYTYDIKDESHPLYNVYRIQPNDHDILNNIIRKFPDDTNLNWIDVSGITYMRGLFESTSFDGDISLWKLDEVTDMNYMFKGCPFNGDISRWRFPNAQTLVGMFADSSFNGDISGWEFPEVRNMSGMFMGSRFNGDISKWEFPKVRDMSSMFANAYFDGDISAWKFPKVMSMKEMFNLADFVQDISGWKIPDGCDTEYMFWECLIPESNKPKL